jgi:ABC-type glycerol-3-phosphate transport system substrate-binding protein
MLTSKNGHFRFALTGMGILVCLLIGSCNPGGEDTTPIPSPTSRLETILPTRTSDQPKDESQSLTIWIPPLLGLDTPAGSILNEHVANFENAYNHIDINIRVKENDGPSGILETLSSASLVAPSTLPEIVLLDPTTLNTAALKGLIEPLDQIIQSPQAPEWYPFAIEAAFVDSTYYGLPFISEAEAFAYRKESFEVEPKNWAELLSSAETILFPLGDQTSKFTLIQYISSGGELVDDYGSPTLDVAILTDLFTFYLSAKEAGQLPLYSLQLQYAEDTWFALTQANTNAAVIPVEVLRDALTANLYSVSPWPTYDGSGVIPTRTFCWAVVSKDENIDDQISQVLQWLRDPGFLGEISETLGMLPVTPAAMQEWTDPESGATLRRLIQVAVPEPNIEEISTFGSLFWNAVEDVLNEHSTPKTAAESIFEQIKIP